jgi:hypothetical protein
MIANAKVALAGFVRWIYEPAKILASLGLLVLVIASVIGIARWLHVR